LNYVAQPNKLLISTFNNFKKENIHVALTLSSSKGINSLHYCKNTYEYENNTETCLTFEASCILHTKEHIETAKTTRQSDHQ